MLRVKIVCMDGTHNTTGYGYHLVTLMIKDQSDMGCPVGHCICTKENTATLEVFLNEIRKKCGHRILVDYVMTDDARQYYNAWCNVMHKSNDPPSPKPIPVKCMWHIIKSWKEQLKTITVKNDYDFVHECLRTMIHTTDANNVQKVIN